MSVVPKVRTPRQASKKSITVRDTRTSKKNSLGRYLNSIDWSVINVHDEYETKYDMFTKLVKIGLDNIMPEKSLKVYPTDVPWMTTKLKDLIRLRQLAFHADRNSFRFKFYRNAVNRERKRCKSLYYSSKVESLKGSNPRCWWKEVRKLSGSVKSNDSDVMSRLYVPDYENMNPDEISNSINAALLEPLQSYTPLDVSASLQSVDEDTTVFLEVSSFRVCNNLRHLKQNKAPGPDGLPNWIFKEYAEILCEPLANILNSSFREQRLPSVWKHANVIPIPKVKQVKDPKKRYDLFHLPHRFQKSRRSL